MNDSTSSEVNVGELITLLQSADENCRLLGAVRLNDLGQQAQPAVPALIALLHSDSVIDRRMAAWTLGHIGAGASEAALALETATQDVDDGVRRFATAALHKITLPMGMKRAA
jgi:HEAT repeat protein